MIYEPYSDWQYLATIGLNPRGDYDPEEQYRFMDFVFYNGSTWVARIDNPRDEPADYNDVEWKCLARGFSEVQVTRIKGESQDEWQSGDVEITREALGLEKVPNLSLEELQKETVSSLSFNHGKQRLRGDIDIPVVNGIIYNGKETRNGVVRINSIEGLVINDQPMQRGVFISDMVTGIKLNGKYKRGQVEINAITELEINGETVEPENGKISLETSKKAYGMCTSDGTDVLKAARTQGDIPEIRPGLEVSVTFEHTNKVADILLSVDDSEPLPVKIGAGNVTDYNKTTFVRNNTYSFLLTDSAWILTGGTTGVQTLIPSELVSSNFYEDDGEYFYELELPVEKEDQVEVIMNPIEDKETRLLLSGITIYPVRQEDGKIILGANALPPVDIPVTVRIN